MKAIIPTFEGWPSCAYSLANLQFPILTWEESLFVLPCVHAIVGEAGRFAERVDAVTATRGRGRGRL